MQPYPLYKAKRVVMNELNENLPKVSAQLSVAKIKGEEDIGLCQMFAASSFSIPVIHEEKI
jgi:hypothetical protein